MKTDYTKYMTTSVKLLRHLLVSLVMAGGLLFFSGTASDQVTLNVAHAQSAKTPGDIFTGDTQARFARGANDLSKASLPGWLVGGPATGGFPETYTGPHKTGYDKAKTNIVTSPLTGNCITSGTATKCTGLTLTDNKAYLVDGPLILESVTQVKNTAQVILFVNGNLRIYGNVLVDTNAFLAVYVKGNISVDPGVGSLILSCTNGPATQIQGWYSTDGSFTTGSKDPSGNGGNCAISAGKDLQLNVAGSIVVNAAGNGTGTFKNQRDLCEDNLHYPSFTIVPRIDMILNAPDAVRVQQFLFREVAP